MISKNKKIKLVLGGDSSEREVSIASGLSIYDSIKDEFETELIYLDNDFKVLSKKLKKNDIVFNALHGGYGENGELLRPSVDAPLDELCNCVLLRVVIVRFHQRKHLAIIAAPLTKRVAVVALFQLDDPDTLAGRTAVLLDNPRLVSHRFLEAFDESRILVVPAQIPDEPTCFVEFKN